MLDGWCYSGVTLEECLMVGVIEATDASAEQQLNNHRNEETETVGDYKATEDVSVEVYNVTADSEEREKRLEKTVNVGAEHIEPEQREQFKEFLLSLNDVFSLGDDDLDRTSHALHGVIFS